MGLKSNKPKKKISLKDVWPQERDYMTRPERFKYVRKLVQSEGCVFCEAMAKPASPENLILYADKSVVVMLNKYPYNNGHLLVLPRRHCGDLLSLSPAEYAAVNLGVRAAVKAITLHYKCKGLNLGLNHGSVAGAGIPEHLHWHVVPRWNGDTNFFPIVAETKVLAETLEQTYDHLYPYFAQGDLGDFANG